MNKKNLSTLLDRGSHWNSQSGIGWLLSRQHWRLKLWMKSLQS